MKSRITRTFIVSAFTAVAVLTGGSAALASTSSAATPALAGNANAVSTVSDVSTASPLAAGPWTYYSNYPTEQACNGGGDYLEQHDNIYDFECVEVEGSQGDFFVWDLYFRIS